MECYRLEVTLKYLAQPFVRKGSYMGLCSTLSIFSEWLFLLKRVSLLHWDENSPGAIYTHCPLSFPCVSSWTESFHPLREAVLVLQCWDGIHREKGPSCFCLSSQPSDHLCAPPLDLLQSVPSFLNCGDQNKDLNV